MRMLLLLVGIALFGAVVRADVDIDPKFWVGNTEQNVCSWASVETVANHLGISDLKGITKKKHDEKTGPANGPMLLAQLDSLKIKYKHQNTGDKSTGLLGEVYNGKPVVVGLQFPVASKVLVRDIYGNQFFVDQIVPAGHMIIVVGIDPKLKKVYVIDPNTPDGKQRYYHWDDFVKFWDGFSLVLSSEK